MTQYPTTKTGAVQAVTDYFAGLISKAEAVSAVEAYFTLSGENVAPSLNIPAHYFKILSITGTGYHNRYDSNLTEYNIAFEEYQNDRRVNGGNMLVSHLPFNAPVEDILKNFSNSNLNLPVIYNNVWYGQTSTPAPTPAPASETETSSQNKILLAISVIVVLIMIFVIFVRRA